jgi:hypothetical protein
MSMFYFTACAVPRTLRIVSMERHEWLFRVPLNDTKPRLETVCWAHALEAADADRLTAEATRTATNEARWRRLT